MNNKPALSHSSDNDLRTSYHPVPEINLSELLHHLWQSKYRVIGITSIFAIASVLIALMLPNIYRAEALLAPASEEQQGGLGGLASQFGGLASMAGINLGSGSSVDKTQLALSVIKSRNFTEQFIERHNILPDLMAADQWNQSHDSVSYDEDLYDVTKGIWVREVNPPKLAKPSAQEAYKVFTEIMAVNLDKDTGLIRLSVEHLSPTIAKSWVDALVIDINTEMKRRDVEEANRSREFLEKQIASTQVADIRTILYQLVEEQMKTIMFAEVRDEYVFKTIDPAVVPEEKAKPSRALICVAITLLGGLFSLGYVLVTFLVRKQD
ncbi:Wzz/FepE/Etk N-terminal domain-containing protein [Shewanella waksmanii]|uniref:Wzz/FepE/Etk N-terminal domain-containing protein n=1 Tax=Shewanella waksmanii TaxID=213783 RepID=UPI00049194FB|nr:Wzz/FepE/Etk N-terminal domain-containing protein [Shewanella waksmanii]